MTLSEATRYVLKHNGGSILSGFLKEDMRTIALEFKNDLKDFLKTNPAKSFSLAGLASFTQIPLRFKHAISLFRREFLDALEAMNDSKQKTVFCFKVIAALGKTVFEIQQRAKKLKRANVVQFIVMELVLKLAQLFISRFVGEVEKLVSDPEDQARLRNIRSHLGEDVEIEEDRQDKAFQIVDNFKNYIMTGK